MWYNAVICEFIIGISILYMWYEGGEERSQCFSPIGVEGLIVVQRSQVPSPPLHPHPRIPCPLPDLLFLYFFLVSYLSPFFFLVYHFHLFISFSVFAFYLSLVLFWDSFPRAEKRSTSLDKRPPVNTFIKLSSNQSMRARSLCQHERKFLTDIQYALI